MDAEGPPPHTLAFPRLAEYLRALGNENRLEILHRLQQPLPASDLRLPPGRSDGQGSDDRIISRVAVKSHLAALEEVGLVSTLRDRGERGTTFYILNHQKLFAVVEELRALGMLASQGAPVAATMATPARDGGLPPVRGPRVILVHGRGEGRVFPLGPRPPSSRGWVVGRKSSLEVSLDYDPFVSSEHAEIVPVAGGHGLLDLRTNVNGTTLNWSRLPKGGERALANGDIIGVGKSLLLFRAD